MRQGSHWSRFSPPVLAAALSLIVCAAVRAQAGGAGGGGGGSDHRDVSFVYVKFRPGIPGRERSALHAARGHEVAREFPQLDLHMVRVPPGKTAAEVCARYERHPLVEFCEPEAAYELQYTPNDPWFPNWQKNLQRLGAEAAWDITAGSADAPIAVIDSGLDRGHFEFLQRIQTGEITGHAFGADDWQDLLGHGTLVAGVIAAQANNGAGIAGAAFRARLMALNGFNGFGSQIDAILFAADNGARVINMSYGAYTPSADLTALQYAYDRGVVLVAAAGNNDTEAKFYPAAHAIVLAVTGIDGSGYDCNYAHGEWIDLAAPCSTLSTYSAEKDTDGDGIGNVGGTSISAPFVAAAAGLVLAVNPALTPAQVMDILRRTADDVGAPGFDPYFGHGRVNFHRAVLAAQGEAPASDLTPPTAEIASPADGAALRGLATVLVSASDDVRVSQVDLHSDGALLSGDTVPP
ncbi:MAG: S8 family serine peptidase, partial [Thermoanaerobaculia bacterium]